MSRIFVYLLFAFSCSSFGFYPTNKALYGEYNFGFGVNLLVIKVGLVNHGTIFLKLASADRRADRSL
jgi:hypothetical protein